MARPREFDTGDVLDKAVKVFWARGYEGAHLSALLEATGLSKSSLYGTFGSKRELYLASIDRYNDQVSANAAATMIAAKDCPKEGIAAVFSTFVDNMTGRSPTRGCFVNNSAGEIAPGDEEATARIACGLDYLEDAFYQAILHCQELGRIDRNKDPRATARFLTAALQGLIVMGKTNPDRAVLQDIADVSLGVLD